MVHPDSALRFVSQEVGLGLFVTRPIPMGTVIWVQDPLDRLLDPFELEAFPAAGREQLARYSSRESTGKLLLFWDHARFMNHSCDPTTLITREGFSVAIRDIEPDEELTEDYAMLHLTAEEAFECHCRSNHCRGRVGPDDVACSSENWSRRLAVALVSTGSVPQPLASLLSQDKLRRALARYARSTGAAPEG